MASSTDQSADWYFARDNQQQGPYPLATLREWARNRTITPTDWIWRAGWENWKPAAEVPELFAPVTTLPGAPPPPSGAMQSAAKSDSPETQANYFVRHWRGELSLPIAYWINNIVLGFAAGVVVGILAGIAGLSGLIFQSELVKNLLWIPVIVALFGFFLWQLVGVWRSASRHTARGGHAFWAVLVKIIVALWGATIAVTIILGLIGLGVMIVEAVRA